MIRNQVLVAASIIVLSLCALGAPIDGTLFTNYVLNTSFTRVSWFVCGSVQTSSGCYASGNLGPFGKIGAMIEGNPYTNLTTNTVTRKIYILDIAAGVNKDAVTLYIYKKTDTITSTDTVTVTLQKTVGLPLSGGTSALGFMAANSKFLCIGTNQSSLAVLLSKSYLTYTYAGLIVGENVAGITADQYGYITITNGDFKTTLNGFTVIGPGGAPKQDGGGAWFMLSTIQSLLPSTLP